MANRVSIAVCLTLGAAFFVGAGCSSIPDNRKVLGSGPGQDGGIDGSSAGGTGVGGAAGSAGGSVAGATGNGGNGPGGVGGKGSGGKAGAAGVSGGGGATIDGGADGGVVGIPCGTKHCADRAVGRKTYRACCAGPDEDRCGLDTTVNGGVGCVEPNQPGVLDPDICRSQTLPDETELPGCCRPDSKCGVVYQLPGGPNLGCVNPLDLGLVAGEDCTPPVCKDAGATCQRNSDCCAGPAGDPVCPQFSSSASVCSNYCITNGDCPSGCCVLLVSGRGACAPDASSCNATCRDKDETCDVDADCCAGNVCSPNSDWGPRLCRPKCTTDAPCAPEFCVKDEAGRGACTTSGAGLCSDTCRYAKDMECDDGGPGSTNGACALGTDCTDCKTARRGGTSTCFDTCTTHNNNKCEDGGPGSLSAACAFGTDCTDCKGPRLGLCSNDCQYAHGGTCDDGGPGSRYDDCALGTDCDDCGIRVGGRKQGLCDGTTGGLCQPFGGTDHYDIEDGTCQCADCPWDVVDCKPPAPVDKCNGVALGACCAHNNPCKLQYDGFCTCGGWCDWETPDCGNVFPPRYCDGSDISPDCDITMPKAALKGNGVCDCLGACSWEAADCASLKLVCTDTCKNKQDGTCDDDDVTCGYGTDCYDCGPRFPRQ